MEFEETDLQKKLRQAGVGFVGSLEGKTPGDLRIEGDNLVWTVRSSDQGGQGRVRYETPLNKTQIEALQDALSKLRG